MIYQLGWFGRYHSTLHRILFAKTGKFCILSIVNCAGADVGSCHTTHDNNWMGDFLCQITHKVKLCVISDISYLSELSHNDPMADLARTPKQIGNIVQRTRKKMGWNQTQLGEKAGLRQETISLIETGNPAAKLETILAVLAALDLEFQVAPRSKGHASDIEDIF